MKTEKEETCADRVRGAFYSRMEDIRELYYACGEYVEGLGSINDYGLCIDRVEAGTFEGQRAPYTRYQLSYGGPAEEFRIYDNGEVEFWFLDWFDGAHIDVDGEDAVIIRAIAKGE